MRLEHSRPAKSHIENLNSHHYIHCMSRKKRSDRNHLIYKISVKSMVYIGVTAVEKRNSKYSLKRRWQKHVSRALTEGKNWRLCCAIRRYGSENFNVEIVEVVRGKSEAHVRERQLIRELKPKLNTDTRAKKVCA